MSQNQGQPPPHTFNLIAVDTNIVHKFWKDFVPIKLLFMFSNLAFKITMFGEHLYI
jgi:hypothetical protein